VPKDMHPGEGEGFLSSAQLTKQVCFKYLRIQGNKIIFIINSLFIYELATNHKMYTKHANLTLILVNVRNKCPKCPA